MHITQSLFVLQIVSLRVLGGTTCVRVVILAFHSAVGRDPTAGEVWNYRATGLMDSTTLLRN